MARAAAAEFGAIREVWGDVLQIFKKNADAWWNKDFAQLGNRYKVTLKMIKLHLMHSTS